jgi:hypothetical protein
MEEKFSVSLELMIQKFKDKAKQVQDVSKNVANKIKENMSVNVGGGAFKGMTAESELLLNKINDIKNTLATQNVGTFKLSKQETLEMRAELEKLESQYDKLNGKSNMFSNSFNKIQSGMDKSLKSAKRFTLSLFGIHSIYRILSRASSSYLAQDEETSSKIQSAWIGLGSVFAPLLQTVANFTIKAVSYINVFIKALTGTDFLANAMSKSMNKANKSAGKLSKTLAGFDELTNLGDDAGGASVDTSWIDNFKSVELDTTWVDRIQSFGEWMKTNWPTVVAILAGTAIAIGLIKLGVNGFMALGIGLILTGLIITIKSIIEFIKNPSWENFSKILIGLAIILAGVAIAMLAVNAANPIAWIVLAIAAIVALAAVIIKNWDWIKDKTGQVVNWILDKLKSFWNWVQNIPQWLRDKFGVVGDIIAQPFEIGIKLIKGIWNGAKQFFGGIKDFFVGIFTLDGNKIKGGLKQMLQGMGNIIISFIEGVLNAFLIPINAAIKLMNKIPGVNIPTLRVSIPRIPKLAVGTDYVPNDMIAQIHEGEKIIPKKFNSDEYVKRSDANNNADVVNKIDELIYELRIKDMNAYISESSIGKASQNYRNLQSRIIGEELI